MKLSKIALAVAALTAGSGVMAAGLPTDLFIVATDTANNNSVILDTGFSVANPSNPTGLANPFNFGVTTPFTVDSNLLTDLGGVSANQVTYSIVAQNAINSDGLGGGIELDTSTNQVIPGSTISQDVVNANAAVGGFFSTNIANFSGGLLIGNSSHTGYEWINATGGVNGGNLGGGAYQAAAAASSTLKFYGLVSDTSDNASDPPVVTSYSPGYWSFNATAGTATWNATAVPLPAAVWMLLSGLAGVGAISRRRASSLAA